MKKLATLLAVLAIFALMGTTAVFAAPGDVFGVNVTTPNNNLVQVGGLTVVSDHAYTVAAGDYDGYTNPHEDWTDGTGKWYNSTQIIGQDVNTTVAIGKDGRWMGQFTDGHDGVYYDQAGVTNDLLIKLEIRPEWIVTVPVGIQDLNKTLQDQQIGYVGVPYAILSDDDKVYVYAKTNAAPENNGDATATPLVAPTTNLTTKLDGVLLGEANGAQVSYELAYQSEFAVADMTFDGPVNTAANKAVAAFVNLVDLKEITKPDCYRDIITWSAALDTELLVNHCYTCDEGVVCDECDACTICSLCGEDLADPAGDLGDGTDAVAQVLCGETHNDTTPALAGVTCQVCKQLVSAGPGEIGAAVAVGTATPCPNTNHGNVAATCVFCKPANGHQTADCTDANTNPVMDGKNK